MQAAGLHRRRGQHEHARGLAHCRRLLLGLRAVGSAYRSPALTRATRSAVVVVVVGRVAVVVGVAVSVVVAAAHRDSAVEQRLRGFRLVAKSGVHRLLDQVHEKEAPAEEQLRETEPTEGALEQELAVRLVELDALADLRGQVEERREQEDTAAEA